MDKTLFYAAGLKFSCKRCSACCRGAPGFVYLSEKDLLSLAETLKMDKNSFIITYCRWVNDWKGDEVLSLKEKSNKDCVLWNNGCIVYSARPLQCITFPFWESIVNSADTWEMAAGCCPGINSGELHSEKTIKDNIEKYSAQTIINRPREEPKNYNLTMRGGL
ncbi:MAG: YkgJ family cysteine cluster protein [Treponema sp.]|nr:YkgJ family cysteine cluster protein [Treponema sp.]